MTQQYGMFQETGCYYCHILKFLSVLFYCYCGVIRISKEAGRF